jgi:hypothetical protein
MAIPENATKLPDNAAYTNRFEVKSGSSGRVYVISQSKSGRWWGCSCPGWKRHKRCKHLTACGLPGNHEKFEVDVPKKTAGPRPPGSKGFLDGYKTYDPASGGHGTPDSWKGAFRARMGLDEAKALLGLADLDPARARAAYRERVAGNFTAVVAELRAAQDAIDLNAPEEELLRQVEEVNNRKVKARAYASWLQEQRLGLEKEMQALDARLLGKLNGEAPAPSDEEDRLREALAVIEEAAARA